MNHTDNILSRIRSEATKLDFHQRKADAVCKDVPGWSGGLHRLFFWSVMASCPQFKRILMVGTYYGRDLLMISEAAGVKRDLMLVGVDKFSAEPCADWPDHVKGKTWDEAWGAPAPSMKATTDNMHRLPESHRWRLIMGDSADVLAGLADDPPFDFIYLDSSHDQETLARELRECGRLIAAGGVIAGDDYNDAQPTWGVRAAVTGAFATHHHIGGMIWLADASNLELSA